MENNNAKPGKVEIDAAPISKSVYVHDPTLPRSARTDSKSIIVVTNRNRVRFEKLKIDDQYDYKMEIDAVEMLPTAWKHAGLPPDGTFTPKFPRRPYDQLQDQYSDYDGFAILAMAACNLVMRHAALSDNDQKPAEVKSSLKLTKPLPDGGSLLNLVPPTNTVAQWDELDEKRMAYALCMLVRLFYRDYGETGDRDLREQELRKAVIMYMSGTGGISQFANFTSLCMAMELAAGFAKSVGVRRKDEAHKDVAKLLDSTMYDSGTPAEPTSDLGKVCSKILGKGIVGRVEEYPKLNNRLKHYGSGKDAEYFYNSVDNITEIMRRLRADAAYVILLGLVKSHGADGAPARTDENHRTSSVILGMVGDCVDRHGTGEPYGSVEEKIRGLGELVENDALKSNEKIYDNARLVLDTFEMLVRAAETLRAPGGEAGLRELIRECEGIMPDRLKPSKYELTGEYDERVSRAWLLDVAHAAVMWMDRGFRAVRMIPFIAQHGRTPRVRFDPDVF